MRGRKVKMEEEMLQYLMQQMQRGNESMTQRPNDAGDHFSPEVEVRAEKYDGLPCSCKNKHRAIHGGDFFAG